MYITYSTNSFAYLFYLSTHARNYNNERPFQAPGALKLSHYNYMAWRSLICVNLPAVDAYEIPIGDEHYPIGAGNAIAIRALQQIFGSASEKDSELP